MNAHLCLLESLKTFPEKKQTKISKTYIKVFTTFISPKYQEKKLNSSCHGTL